MLVYDSDSRGEKLEAASANAAAISRHGIGKAELGQDLINRWSKLEQGRRDELARKLLVKLDPGLQPDPERLRLQLQRPLDVAIARLFWPPRSNPEDPGKLLAWRH